MAVPPFRARVAAPELGPLVAEALRREVASGGALRLAPAGEADAVLEGTVVSLDEDPDAFRTVSGAPLATAWTTRVEAVVLLRPRDGSATRKIGPVMAEALRAAGATDLADAAARDRALRALAAELAHRLYRVLVGRSGP